MRTFNTALLVLVTTNWTLAQQPYSTQAGYHVIYSYSGVKIPQDLLEATGNGTVGGVILFGDNVGADTASEINKLQATYRDSPNYPGYPLLILTDQEGGEVNRLPGGPSKSAKSQGQSGDPAYAAATAGKVTANGFAEYHVNGDLAPILGVYRQPGDFLDNFERSYGNSADLVSRSVGGFIDGLQGAGYPATAKHFPGLGAAGTNENTDERPVTINLPLDELRSVDEAPYSTAISHGVKMVMPSWAVYPSLDSSMPAGLSSKWIKSELRGRLGFTGVTISDSIGAGGLNNFGDSNERSLLAMQAGMDVILATGRSTSQGEGIVATIARAVADGGLQMAEFSGSAQRVKDLRKPL